MLIKGFLASYGATHFFASFPTFDILESLCSNVIVDLWYMILNHFGVNHLISVVFTEDGPTD